MTSSYDTIRTTNEEDTQKLSFEAAQVSSIDELRTEMNRIGSIISTTKTNWQTRVSCIQQIGSIIAGGILKTFCSEFIDLLFTFRDGICIQITELRSGVAKEIFHLLSYLAMSLDSNEVKQEIQPFIDYVIPYVLKQTQQTILVISHGSNITLRTILKRIPIYKSINHIITNTNSKHQKSICLRVRCIEYLQIIIETHSYHNHYLTNDVITAIIDAVIVCIADPHQTVRYIARQCVWSLNNCNMASQQYIFSKISNQNIKYVQNDKSNYKMLPSPIGNGHKIVHRKHNTNNNNKTAHKTMHKISKKTKTALPSRTHRLALLKQKRTQMSKKPLRNNDIIMVIKGNATRNHNNTNNAFDAYKNILNEINNGNINGIRELTKWLKTNANCNISEIILSLNGFIDSMHSDQSIEPIILCINNLIFSSNIAIQDLIPLFGKVFELFIVSNGSECNEYINKYNEFNYFFEILSKSLMQKRYSLKSLIYNLMNLSQTTMATKHKIIWLHFISVYCKQTRNETKNESNDNKETNELINYLFNLLKECINSNEFIEYHSLFRAVNVFIIDNILTYIVHNDKYNNLFEQELNASIIEKLLGIIKNKSVIQILQTHYSSFQSQSQNQNQSLTPTFTTPLHQTKKYQIVKKRQIASMTTPPLNMYISTPMHSIHNTHSNSLYNAQSALNELSDQELVRILLTNDANYIKSVFDQKNALKYLSHRINGNSAVFDEKCKDILCYVINIMNCNEFILHRNALRIVQAICWFYPKYVNQNIEQTLMCLINLFRNNAPQESGELALDVITQFCKIINYELCIKHLLPIIQNEIENENKSQRKMFASLSIFDRIIVLSPMDWLRKNIEQFTNILIEAYQHYREPMRSLIYLCIIFDGDTSFLNQYIKEKKIVEMMSKETDFTDWVKSHRKQ